MAAIIIGLRPGDHRLLKELAEARGRPPQELAGIFLEQAIRRARPIRRDAEPATVEHRPLAAVEAS